MTNRGVDDRLNGFSLAEVLLALAIVGILLAMVSLNFRSQQGRSSSKALAQLLTEELRQVQVKARRDQRPVAVVFPSQNGSKAFSQGFYQLEGYGTPKLRRSASFASENSRAQVMVGVWPVLSPNVNGINQGPPPPAATRRH